MLAAKQWAFAAVAVVAVLALPLLFADQISAVRASAVDFLFPQHDTSRRHLHLMLPVTSTGPHLCRLLISAGLNDYPDPVFVGWNGTGIYDGSDTHLFKITGTLNYLDGLPASSDTDLFLMLDAFDILLQLRLEVLISRYFRLLERSNQRLNDQGILGKYYRGAEVKNSVLLGPDKMCAPQTSNQAACWAVPESPLPTNFLGPHTDTSTFTNRARWLNSGTIMGPVSDVRAVFRATFDMLGWEFADGGSHTSDQFYFAEVWGEQEVERIRLKNASRLTAAEEANLDVPKPLEGKRTEFHMTLDYETSIFQTASGYDRHITWMSYNHSTASSFDAQQRITKRMDEWTLPEDILASEPPFAAIEHLPTAPTGKSWSDVMLGVFTMKQDPFPIIHITGNKWLREEWWKKMWFHPHAEKLLIETKKRRHASAEPDVLAVVDGLKWREWQRKTEETDREDLKDPKVPGGGWTGHGQFLPYQDLCGKWATELYNPT